MAMLAERKRKQKWSLNPRGKDWAEDSNKFGQKMLEKMGWSQGKGLGANENGVTEHVKISYKNDSKGMGYKESNNQWTEHEHNFSSLLENLTGAKPELDLKEVSSLEKKSQKSRARVHYHKFTRGKDLSRYSEKDLANIFGKKTLKENKKFEQTEEDASSMGTIEIKSESSSFTINSGSMADYFKKKMSGFGKNTHGYVIGSNGVLKKEDSESESEIRNFGFGFTTIESSEKCNGVVSNEESEVKIKKKHVKSSFVSYVEGSNEENVNKHQDLNGDSDHSTPNNKKRKVEELIDEQQQSAKKLKNCKKQKKSVENEECQGITNPAFDPLRTSIKLEKHILNPIEENEDSLVVEETSSIMSCKNIAGHKISGETSLNIDNNEKQVSKKSKKKKHSEEMINGVENSVFYDNINSQSSFGVDTIENCEYNGKKLKRKSKKKLGEIKNGVENCVFYEGLDTEECDNSQIEENPYEVKIIVNKKKDKTKKKCEEKTEDFAIVNPNFSLNSSEETSTINEETSNTAGEFEVKRKNKKSKKKKGCAEEEIDTNFAIENPIFNDSLEGNNSVIVQEDTSKFEVKRKSKKEKKKKRELEEININGLDNPALNVNDKNDSNEDSLTVDLMLNVTDEKTVEDTSSTKVVNERFTITKVNTVKRRKSVRFSDVNEEILIPNNEELKEMERRQELVEINKQVINSSEEPIFDIQLNVVSSPQIKEKAQSNSVDENNKKKIKKNKRNKQEKGVTNNAFDTQTHLLEENVETISKTLEKYQAEIENDINEKKAMEETSEDLMNTNIIAFKTVEIDDVMVGEVGNPHGENARLPDGSVKLKFKNAKFGKSASYIDGLVGPRKSYKHLIKGDIVLNFKESNLHEIEGYASSLMHVRETAV